MSTARLATRYAKSLLDLAIERGELDEVIADINGFHEALKSRDFYLMLKSPVIPPARKAEIFSHLFKGKAREITFGFFMMVIRKGREAALPDIIQSFIGQYKKLRNIVGVTVVTAVPMDAATEQAIRAKLTEIGAITGEIEMQVKVDPSLIGGFQIEFDDRLIDTSISGKLMKMRRDLAINLYESKIRSI